MKQKNLSNKANNDPVMHKLIGKHDWKEHRHVHSFKITRVCRACGEKEELEGLSTYATIGTTNLASGTSLTLEDLKVAVDTLKAETRLDFS